MTYIRSKSITVAGALSLLSGFGYLSAQGVTKTAQAKVTLTPDQVKWAPVSSLLPGAFSAVIFGAPDKPGPYAYRVKFPPNFHVQPHSHPETRTYTVLSGTFYQGEGDKFDESKLMARPAGSYYTWVGGLPHFGATKDEEVVLQISSCDGPTAIRYVDPADDPRLNKK
jgi:hypothetical protein